MLATNYFETFFYNNLFGCSADLQRSLNYNLNFR